MRKLFCLSLIAGCILVIGGCKKDKNDDDPSDPAAPQTKRLKSYSEVQASDSFAFTLVYDNAGRVTALNGTAYTNGVSSGSGTIYYSYSGSDSLISKIDYGSGNASIFKYNSAGQMITDSAVGPFGEGTYTFRYLPDFISIDSDYGDTAHVYREYSNGNPVSEKDTVFGPVHQDTVSFQVSYDNHPNPFRIIALKRPAFYIAEHLSNPDREYYTTHNLKEVTGIKKGNQGGVQNVHLRYDYVYDSDNYPVSVRLTDVTTSQLLTKRYFYY